MRIGVALDRIPDYSEGKALIDGVLACVRRLAETGQVRVSLHATERCHERGIKLSAIQESIAAGDFRYIRHEPGKRGDITVRIKCLHRTTGVVFTAQLAVTRDLNHVFVLSVWD